MTNESVLRSVLDHSRNVAGPDTNFVVFAKPEGEEGIDREVWVDVADFAALGEPEQITVTIEPGDKLNG